MNSSATEEIFCLDLQLESHPLFFCHLHDAKDPFPQKRVSKNHWDQKEHLEVILSNPTPQAGTPRASYAGWCLISCFWISPRLHKLCGNLWQGLVMLIIKNCLLIFRGKLLGFRSVFPLTLVLSLLTIAKNLVLSSLYPPFRNFIYA